MTLTQMNYIITISETGSLNKAAETLYISQPSLTNAVKELEKELGITIFNRSGRGVTLTNDGTEFLMYARQIYGQYESVLEKYSEGGSYKKKFGVSTQHYSFAVNAFVDVVQAYDAEKYDFILRETQTGEIIDDVANGKSELGVIYLSEHNEEVLTKLIKKNGLIFEELFTAEPHVFISNRHPLAAKEKIQLEDLKPYPYLTYEQGERNSFYYAEEFLSMLDMPKNIQVRDRATMFNLIIGLNGFTVCSGVISEELNGSQIIARPLAMDVQMRIGLVKKKNILFSRYADTYIEALKKYVSIG